MEVKELNNLFTKQLQLEKPADFDSAIEQISTLKNYIESAARELNINFNFNGF